MTQKIMPNNKGVAHVILLVGFSLVFIFSVGYVCFQILGNGDSMRLESQDADRSSSEGQSLQDTSQLEAGEQATVSTDGQNNSRLYDDKPMPGEDSSTDSSIQSNPSGQQSSGSSNSQTDKNKTKEDTPRFNAQSFYESVEVGMRTAQVDEIAGNEASNSCFTTNAFWMEQNRYTCSWQDETHKATIVFINGLVDNKSLNEL